MATRAAAEWISSVLKWLTPRRLRAQAIVLVFCLWGVCVVDFATPGLFDRAGNIKFQDFLPFYVSARLMAHHRAIDIYDQNVQLRELQSIVGPTQVEIPYLYGPQVALLFVPFTRLSFATAAWMWSSISVLMYFACIHAVWKRCQSLSQGAPSLPPFSREKWGFALATLAFPPLFHVFVRGQVSVLILVCFTLAFLAFNNNRPALAGIALGFLMMKPPFLIAISLVLLFAGAWRSFAGLAVSAMAQLVFARFYFGGAVMRAYLELMLRPDRWINATELSLAPIQMHSLRSFWALLIPLPIAAFALYILTSVIVIVVTIAIWRSHLPLSLRYSGLILSSVLVNPHLFVYDLLVLTPALLLIVDWCLTNEQAALRSELFVFSYLAFILPLFGPVSRWTHLQFSVIAFIALLWTLFCFTRISALASTKSPVV